jgi:hypothetical protein
MDTEQLQFIFSLFSFVGVVGILFYIILDKAKQDEQSERVELLEEKFVSLRDYVYKCEERLEEKEEVVEEENFKEKIITLHEEGKDLSVIEDALKIPRAKIEMVLKFHNLQKSDNWRNSVDENL